VFEVAKQQRAGPACQNVIVDRHSPDGRVDFGMQLDRPGSEDTSHVMETKVHLRAGAPSFHFQLPTVVQRPLGELDERSKYPCNLRSSAPCVSYHGAWKPGAQPLLSRVLPTLNLQTTEEKAAFP
jgi:hypothetical protein